MYKPAGAPLCDLPAVTLDLDELEALQLCDGSGLTQAEAGECMGVSRGTVQRVLAVARKKVANALADGRALVVRSGG